MISSSFDFIIQMKYTSTNLVDISVHFIRAYLCFSILSHLLSRGFFKFISWFAFVLSLDFYSSFLMVMKDLNPCSVPWSFPNVYSSCWLLKPRVYNLWALFITPLNSPISSRIFCTESMYLQVFLIWLFTTTIFIFLALSLLSPVFIKCINVIFITLSEIERFCSQFHMHHCDTCLSDLLGSLTFLFPATMQFFSYELFHLRKQNHPITEIIAVLCLPCLIYIAKMYFHFIQYACSKSQ